MQQDHLKFETPDEPANVNWGNLHVPKAERQFRKFSVILALIALLCISFSIQKSFARIQFSNDTYEKIDCGIYKYTEQKILQRQAYATWAEYFYERNSEEHNGDIDNNLPTEIQQMNQRKTSFINGTLSCFCDF